MVSAFVRVKLLIMGRIRCINIDWLEVYALEDRNKYPCDADYFRTCGCSVSVRDYGTRVYREMFTVLDEHDNPFVEVRRNPSSSVAADGGLFPAESCHLRLSNYACYSNDPIGDLRGFMVRHGYTLVRIFRLDICLDFIAFDKGDDPSRFVRRYIEGRYSKVNQTNLSAHGKDSWQERSFNSLSWGAQKSMVSTKMYNKSLELLQAKDKPYIRYAWFLAGLIDNPITGTVKQADGTVVKPDVWRVEFSIKSSGKKWFVMENSNLHKRKNEYIPHTLDCYDSKGKLLTAFANLARCYFHFKVFEPDVRKDRCKDKVLFEFAPSDVSYTLKGNVSAHRASPFLNRLIKYLYQYVATSINPHAREIATTLIRTLESQQVNMFAGSALDEESILVLQRLISERVGGLKESEREIVASEIKTLVRDLFATAW